MFRKQSLVIFIALVLMSGAAEARDSRVPVPRAAPEWAVTEWLNENPGSLADLKGQVVVIEFFQL